jgi:GNAT superfamily N-acetyltransferase
MKTETRTTKTLRHIANLEGTIEIYNDGFFRIYYTTVPRILVKIKYMQRAARKEDATRSFSEESFFRIISSHGLREYFDSFILETSATAGFSIWNVSISFNEPVLRQIYVKPSFRGRGLANVMIDAVLNFYRKYISFEEWLVESPNNIMIRVLKKRSDFDKIKSLGGG